MKYITNLYRGIREYIHMVRGYHRCDKHADAYAEMSGHIQDTLEYEYGHVGLMLCRIVDRVVR